MICREATEKRMRTRTLGNRGTLPSESRLADTNPRHRGLSTTRTRPGLNLSCVAEYAASSCQNARRISHLLFVYVSTSEVFQKADVQAPFCGVSLTNGMISRNWCGNDARTLTIIVLPASFGVVSPPGKVINLIPGSLTASS